MLVPDAVLLALLAIASVAVLVGSRLAEYTRRVGLLKAVGASPSLVAATFLTENLVLAWSPRRSGWCPGGSSLHCSPALAPLWSALRTFLDAAHGCRRRGYGPCRRARIDARSSGPGCTDQHRQRTE